MNPKPFKVSRSVVAVTTLSLWGAACATGTEPEGGVPLDEASADLVDVIEWTAEEPLSGFIVAEGFDRDGRLHALLAASQPDESTFRVQVAVGPNGEDLNDYLTENPADYDNLALKTLDPTGQDIRQGEVLFSLSQEEVTVLQEDLPDSETFETVLDSFLRARLIAKGADLGAIRPDCVPKVEGLPARILFGNPSTCGGWYARIGVGVATAPAMLLAFVVPPTWAVATIFGAAGAITIQAAAGAYNNYRGFTSFCDDRDLSMPIAYCEGE